MSETEQKDNAEAIEERRENDELPDDEGAESPVDESYLDPTSNPTYKFSKDDLMNLLQTVAESAIATAVLPDF